MKNNKDIYSNSLLMLISSWEDFLEFVNFPKNPGLLEEGLNKIRFIYFY